jgi:hypothetical protein
LERQQLDRREFHYDKATRWVLGILGVGIFGFGVFCLTAGVSSVLGIPFFAGPADPHPLKTELLFIPGGLLIAGFGLYSIRIFLVAKIYEIVVDQEGISYLWPRPGGRKLTWGEIASLRFRRILQRLDLIDSNGASALSIDCQIENFDELVGIVVAKVIPNLSPVPLPRMLGTKQSRTDVIVVIVGTITLIVVGLAIASRDQFLPILAFTIVFAAIYLSFRSSSYIVVTSEGVALETGFRSRTIPSSDVKEVTLRAVPGRRGGKYLTVRLVLADGSEVDVRPLGCDPFEVLRTILAAVSINQR